MSTGSQRADRLVERMFVKPAPPGPVVSEEKPRGPTSVAAQLDAIRSVRRHTEEFKRSMRRFR